ncbi:MAG: COX15/CtaA family protein [Bdellovibrionales bacterium]|nr:COX15/CtaA family protein [Bdellovibrionales bacterium]
MNNSASLPWVNSRGIPRTRKFSQSYCLFLAGFALLIILWGAFVRISGSGDGCGDHWPLCHGNFVPNKTLESIIEFLHRSSSGLFLCCSLALPWLVARATPRRHLARSAAIIFVITVIIEALIGALLVLAGLVADDASTLRAIVMSGHLVNTLLLFGSLIACWGLLAFKVPQQQSQRLNASVFILLFYYIVTAMFGAFAALASALFPAESLSAGLEMDLAAAAHAVLQLRALHPVLGLGFILVAFYFFSQRAKIPEQQFKLAMALIISHCFFGVITFLSLSPVWMKLVHLASVELTWMYLIALFIPLYFQEKLDPA